MFFKLTNTAASAISCLLLAGLLASCSEQGTTSAPAAAGDAPAAAVRASVPAEAQFKAAADTAEALKAMTQTGACSLENVVNMADNSLNPGDVPNSYKVGTGNAYKMIGFATNVDAGTVPKTIRIVLSGAQVYSIDSVTGSERPDVATFFKKPALANAGYQADAAFDDVAPGEYSVLLIETDGPAPIACPTHQTITIK